MTGDEIQDVGPVEHWDEEPPRNPPWVGDSTAPAPDLNAYMESELFVAGAISTLPPFSSYHPAWALPIAREALDALSEWEPSE